MQVIFDLSESLSENRHVYAMVSHNQLQSHRPASKVLWQVLYIPDYIN